LPRTPRNSLVPTRRSSDLNATGSYTYVINNADPAVDQLNSGGTLTDSFTYKVSDGAGGFDTTTLTVTIHGTDDAPVVSNLSVTRSEEHTSELQSRRDLVCR